MGRAAGRRSPPPFDRQSAMETRAHYVAVGAFVLTMTVLGFAAVLWMGRSELTTQYAKYDMYFVGPVSGLRIGAAVEYSGVPIGKVSEVRIDPNNVELIRVTADIDSNVVIKIDARAAVETNILSGVSYIQIVGNTQDAAVLQAQAGERYPVIQSHRSRFANVVARAPQLLEKAEEALDRVNDLLNEKNRQSISEAIENIRTFSAGLADQRQAIADLIAMRTRRRSPLRHCSTMSTTAIPVLTGWATAPRRRLPISTASPRICPTPIEIFRRCCRMCGRVSATSVSRP